MGAGVGAALNAQDRVKVPAWGLDLCAVSGHASRMGTPQTPKPSDVRSEILAERRRKVAGAHPHTELDRRLAAAHA